MNKPNYCCDVFQPIWIEDWFALTAGSIDRWLAHGWLVLIKAVPNMFQRTENDTKGPLYKNFPYSGQKLFGENELHSSYSIFSEQFPKKVFETKNSLAILLTDFGRSHPVMIFKAKWAWKREELSPHFQVKSTDQIEFQMDSEMISCFIPILLRNFEATLLSELNSLPVAFLKNQMYTEVHENSSLKGSPRLRFLSKHFRNVIQKSDN